MNTKIVKVSGTEYTLQKLAPREFYLMKERCTINGQLNDLKMYDELFEHVVVNPKVTLDDFEDVETIEGLMKEALTFQLKRTEGIVSPKGKK